MIGTRNITKAIATATGLRTRSRRFALVASTVTAFSLGAVVAGSASAMDPFIFSGKPIHPGCIHALAMADIDAIPVTKSISLEGCMASARSKAEVTLDKKIYMIQDDELLGEGAFGYAQLASLDNGLSILGILHVPADGTERISLAAVDLVERPTLRNGQVFNRLMLEMIGEVRLPNILLASLKTTGNMVHFSAGTGASRVMNTIDLSAIGRARDRKK